MKKYFSFLAGAALLACATVSCNKAGVTDSISQAEDDQIVFRSQGPSIEAGIDTKTTALTSLDSFKASATKGASETQVWTNATFTKSGTVYKGDKWWPKDDETYHFYASNAELTYSSSGNTVHASNTTDVLCAYMASPTYKGVNTLQFKHIFARLGSVTVSASEAYTITGVDIKITPITGGTYNLKTGSDKTDGTGWSETTAGAATAIANATPGTKSNDIYLVPGTYALTATWTATKGEYTETFTSKTVNVNLVAGKINNISASLKGDATEITFKVEIASWTNNSVDAGTFPVN